MVISSFWMGGFESSSHRRVDGLQLDLIAATRHDERALQDYQLLAASGLKTVAVNYHYKLADVPSWANNADIKTAFPDINSALGANPADTATLTMNGDQWVFTGK